jgi:hypothetical protein
MSYRGGYEGLTKHRGKKAASQGKLRKDEIIQKFRNLIVISRSYMEFLRKEERGTTLAYLFENLMKSLILIVDEVIEQFEKYSKDKV